MKILINAFWISPVVCKFSSENKSKLSNSITSNFQIVSSYSNFHDKIGKLFTFLPYDANYMGSHVVISDRIFGQLWTVSFGYRLFFQMTFLGRICIIIVKMLLKIRDSNNLDLVWNGRCKQCLLNIVPLNRFNTVSSFDCTICIPSIVG